MSPFPCVQESEAVELASKLEDKAWALEHLLGPTLQPEGASNRLRSEEARALTEHLYTTDRYEEQSTGNDIHRNLICRDSSVLTNIMYSASAVLVSLMSSHSRWLMATCSCMDSKHKDDMALFCAVGPV